MAHKCLRCHIPMKNLGKLHLVRRQLNNHRYKETNVPFHVEVCPKCGHAELFKVE